MIAGTFFCSGISAQQGDSIGWKDFEQVKNSSAWLYSKNAAGLQTLPDVRMSVIEGYADKGYGEFVNYGKSDNSLTLGASAESYYRLNPKVVFYGLLDYSSFVGKNMAGSYLIDPDDAPFNIVEYTDDNRGEKNMEHYHLTGAVSVELSDKFILGGKLDYTTANYAKMKDLRHKSELMDLEAGIGMLFKMNSKVELGADAVYRRRVEGVFIDMYGKTDKTYNSLIDYGAFWGRKEQFGENGYTSDGEEKPLTDTYYGGSVQINWQISNKWELFNEVSARVRDGYYGKKSPSTVVFSNHSGMEVSYMGRLSMRQERTQHFFMFNTRYRHVDNKENIYRYDNEGGGLNNVNYYGELDTSDKRHYEAEAAYTGYWNMNGENPVWITKGSFGYFHRDITASMYPYYRKQQLHWYRVNMSLERMIYRKKETYTLHIGVSGRKGGGEPYKDNIYATTSSNQTTPQSMPLYLMQEYEYLTKTSVKGDIGVKYARKITDSGIKAHILFSYGYTKAFDTTYLQGNNLHECRLAIGCIF